MKTQKEKIVAVLEKAIEFADGHGVFDVVKNQPPFATLLGLIVEQGRRFSVTRSIRGSIWTAMGGKNFTPAEFMSRQKEWDQWEPLASRRDTFLRVTQAWLSDKEAEKRKWKSEKGIGPWTIAAHKIMTSQEKSVALEGDAHISKMMRGISSWSILKQQVPNRLTDLSRLFWRLTSRGRLHIIRCITDDKPLELVRHVHFF